MCGGDLLRLQLHVYSGALEDPECQEIARRGFLRIWRTVAGLTRAPAAEVLDFLAHGILVNVLVALGFPLPTGREAPASSFETWAADSPAEPPASRPAS
ncbi:hypothetical protein E2C11_03340 [Streptomyces lavendulae]|nr:hypothetical protein [Streptomyces lavendulae]TXJ86172.1 hypothetical protein E2C11_03340 [Streptomyces lavendulae]